ncbi:hypothetical protein F3J45_00980 [Pantoea sp. Ap-967]|uniref:hypothetical protein n=1 Tax=Pantoea sp. Ap-967 TaxID=2608362 RepID=UPI00141E3DAB|nr:hypothetical protein [Pantoea sp. Ap-967]NIE73040.1 hypothetical protein [Pantoea sp. Ap-967]
MSEIDWSKAPEGATHFGAENEFYFSAWYRVEGEQILAYTEDGSMWREATYSCVFPKVSSLSARPQQWSGEGLPPVGSEVEIQRGGWTIREESAEFIGAEVTVCAVFQTARGVDMIAVDGGADLGCEVFRAEMARPVPTPEEKAEAERVAGLNEMIRHMKDHPGGTHGVSHMQQLMIHEDVARDLWAAGYRKQEKP